MRIETITTATRLVSLWPFFSRGYKHLVDKAHFIGSEVDFLKACCTVIGFKDKGVILVLWKDERPVAFGVAHDRMFLFDHRQFSVYAAFAEPSEPRALQLLIDNFEQWCRNNKVKEYFVTSSRHSGAANRCFTRKYKFKQDQVFYKKEL